MTALEYMQKQAERNRIKYERESKRGVPDEMLRNIAKKIGYYEDAVKALENDK